MSIYATLLDDALGQVRPDKPSTTGDALAQLLDIRRRLGANLSGYTGADWAPDAIADQLAYDVALIELSRLLGIEVSLAGFGQPKHERARLEKTLATRGVRLHEFDTAMPSGEHPGRRYGQR
jgi:hypothetical protein